MKKLRYLLMLGLTLGMAGAAFATPCDNSTLCEDPSSNGTTQAGWVASASGLSGIKCLNSVGPTGNASGSHYYFSASTTSFGATTAKGTITTDNNGFVEIGPFTLNSTNTPGGTVNGGSVAGTLRGGKTYFIYAEACGSAEALDSANCSTNWVLVGSMATSAYPASVFNAPTKPTDATVNSINSRTNVPAADASFISQIQYEIDDLITPANNQTGIIDNWVGNGTYLIDNTLYTNGFLPNDKYQYKGQVFYPYGVPVPTSAQTVSTFWTTPENPGTVTVSNITHCSAHITCENSNVATPNPTYTEYSLCATGNCVTSGQIGQTPLQHETTSVIVTGLLPNTSYQPRATALVGTGADNTANGWNNSGTTTAGNFTTLDWGGNLVIYSSDVFYTSATFSISGLIGAGTITTWSIVYGAGATVLVSGSGDPSGLQTATGLIPNTNYGGAGGNAVRLILNEAGGCASTLNFAPTSFATEVFAPTNPSSITAVTATSLHANWTDGTANPNGTNYQVQYCTTGFGTGTCATNSSASKPTVTATINSLTPATSYYVQVRSIDVGAPTPPDSDYLQIGQIVTLNSGKSISINPSTATVATGNTANFVATVTDDNGTVIPGQAVAWSGVGAIGNLSSNNAASTVFTATTAGGPTNLVASLAGYTDATSAITVVNSGVNFTVSPAATVFLTSATLSATATAFGGHNISYTWSVLSGPGGSVTFSPNGAVSASGAQSTSVATLSMAGNYTIQCVATDQTTLLTATQSVMFTVSQVLSSIAVSPNSATITFVNSQTFMAAGKDQFGSAFTLGSVSWSSTGGTISGAGVFQSGSLGTNITVTASSVNSLGMTIHGTASVSVVNYDVSTSFAYPTPYKSTSGAGGVCFTGLGTDSHIRIYTVTGRKVFEIEVANSPAPTTPPHCDYTWNVKNSAGESVASGVYLYVIESPTTKKNGKLIIIQ